MKKHKKNHPSKEICDQWTFTFDLSFEKSQSQVQIWEQVAERRSFSIQNVFKISTNKNQNFQLHVYQTKILPVHAIEGFLNIWRDIRYECFLRNREVEMYIVKGEGWAMSFSGANKGRRPPAKNDGRYRYIDGKY